MQRKLIKNLLLVLTMVVLCLAVGLSASAEERPIIDSGECGAQGDNVIWTLYDDGELVISGEGAMKDYFGDWGGISTDWYEYDIYKVTIENGVTHIGAGAFYSGWSYKNKIAEVIMADSIKSIGQQAFYMNNDLSEIYLSKALCEISEETFRGCKSLENIEIPDSVTTIGDRAFLDCDSITAVTIPASVSEIGESVFGSCDNLKKVVLENGLSYVGVGMFSNCRNLESLTIPDSVKKIDDYAFEDSALEKIVIPASVEVIREMAFGGYNLKEFVVDPNNKNYSSDENGVLFDKNKTKLIQYPNGKTDTKYIVPETIKTICSSAFYGLLDLEEIIFPESLETIEYGAILCSPSLVSITIPENVKLIDSLAFCYSTFIDSVYIKSIDATFNELALTTGNLRISVSREEFKELGKRFVAEKEEEKRQKIFDEIDACLTYVDGFVYPTIYCHEGSTAEAYATDNGIKFELTHFFEDDWTYDYENSTRTRKCIHCDELETEAIEPDVPTEPDEPDTPEEPDTPDEPIIPDEPQVETKDNFFSKIIDLINSFFELIMSWFKK